MKQMLKISLLAGAAILAVATTLQTVVHGLAPRNRTIVDTSRGPEAIKDQLKNLRPDEISALANKEKDRLLAEPLDLRALSNLAVLKTLSKDMLLAQNYGLLAANRSFHEPFTQLTAADYYLHDGDYANGMAHLDAVLSTHLELGPQVYPVLFQLLDRPAAIEALGKIIAAEPKWRHTFMEWFADNDLEGKRVFLVLEAVKGAGGTAGSNEVRNLIATQIKQRNYDKAYYFWLDSLNQSQLTKVGNLYDGQLVFQPTNQFFGWNIAPIKNVEMFVNPSASRDSGSELNILFINNEEAFAQVYQFLHLQPGSFELTGEWSSEILLTTGGLVWNMTCLSDNAQLGRSKAFASASPNSKFSFQFTVPEKNCDYQMLQLTNASAAVLDRKINGKIAFSNFAIDSVP